MQWFEAAADLPQHIADTLALLFNGSVACIGGGMLLLLVCAVLLLVRGRRSRRDTAEEA